MKKHIRLIVLIIGFITTFSGVVPLVFTAFALKNVGIGNTPATVQLFATIGMYMVCFGGLIINGIYSAADNNVLMLWAGLQKFASAAAVSIGILHGIFNHLSIGIALTDFFSGVFIIYYYKCLKTDETYS